MLPSLFTPGFLFFLLTLGSADGQYSVVGLQTVQHASDSCLRAGDEMWLVSTRHLGCPDLSDPSTLDLDVRNYDEQDGWKSSTLEQFNSAESTLTIVYVHGNRYSWSDAIEYGWKTYYSLRSCCGEVPRLRFVIWSWPSDKICGPLRDIRVKANRAEVEGMYLGWFVSQLKPTTRLSLFGFSYGSRAISGGLQVLGDGNLNGQQLPDSMRNRDLALRVVYMAPAIDTYWLYPGNYHGDSVQLVDKMLILYNTCDPVLKRYRFVNRCSRPSALGYTGMNVDALGEVGSRIEQYNAAPFVGRTHEEELYTESSAIMSDVCRIVLWQDHVKP